MNFKRQTFSKNVIEFCRKWGFDGIDLGDFLLLIIDLIFSIILKLFQNFDK